MPLSDEDKLRIEEEERYREQVRHRYAQGGDPEMLSEKHPVTIQETAKQWKTVQLIGMAGIAVGFVAAIAADGLLGASIMAIGLAVYLGGRIASWWHHG